MNNTLVNTEENWKEEDWTTFKWYLRGVLQESPEVTVVFTKTDGTERTMKCTLDPSILPKQEIKEGATPKKQNDSVLAVYDIEVQGWRSFRLKSVKEVVINQ